MELHVIGSGSKGNAYLLTSSTGERLLVELGVEWHKIQEALNWNYDDVTVLVSHSHGDHSRSFWKFVQFSNSVFMSSETFSEIVNSKKSLYPFQLPLVGFIMPYDSAYFGGFTVIPFPLQHDVPCMGFLIHHPECGTICFITDTMKAETKDGKPFDFPGVTHWLVEANYCESILLDRVYNGMNATVAERVVNSHFSVQACEKMLLDQDLTEAQTICLLHLSDGNSNAREFKQRIEKATGVPTCIAEAGLKIKLDII